MEGSPCGAVSRPPASFSTSAQLLRLRHDSFFHHQSLLRSSLSSLCPRLSCSDLQQYSAVVGFTTSHSRFLLPWIVFSEPDSLARAALGSILGSECGVGEEGVVLLDRLDLTELVGNFLSTAAKFDSTGVGSLSVVGVDMALSSLLQDTERLAAGLALSSVQSLFQSVGPIPIPQTARVGKVSSRFPSDAVPVPFQRVCLLLRQHFYWVPTSQLDQLPWKQIESDDRSCVIRTCAIGQQSGVKCVSLSHLPLQRLIRWYQVVNFFQQLNLQIEPATSDIQHLLTDILTLF